jgi:hypothetical protein
MPVAVDVKSVDDRRVGIEKSCGSPAGHNKAMHDRGCADAREAAVDAACREDLIHGLGRESPVEVERMRQR